MDASPGYKSVHSMCAMPIKTREVLDPWEPELQMVMSKPHECWNSNPGPLEEQPVFLTTELSFQPLCTTFKWFFFPMDCLKFL